jgi:GDP-L-fucose synthase
MLPEFAQEQLRGRVALVTGGTGLIGRQVVQSLEATGARVRIVSLDKVTVSATAEHVYGDLCDFSTCKALTKDVDFVLHLAGIKGSVEVTKARPASFFVPLLMMNTNLLEACRVNSVKRAVYTSSIGAYSSAEVFREGENEDGAPMDTYPGWAKRMAEMQIQAYKAQYGIDSFAVVRPCNVYGPGDNFDPKNAMVIPALMWRVLKGENPVSVWGDGSAIRDFAFSRDVAEGVILALLKGTRGSYVNLGSGRGVTIRELVEALQKVIPFEAHFDSSKPSGFPRRVMDMTRAREWLGYEPATSLEQGLRETWAWFVDNQNEYEKKKNYFAEESSKA